MLQILRKYQLLVWVKGEEATLTKCSKIQGAAFMVRKAGGVGWCHTGGLGGKGEFPRDRIPRPRTKRLCTLWPLVATSHLGLPNLLCGGARPVPVWWLSPIPRPQNWGRLCQIRSLWRLHWQLQHPQAVLVFSDQVKQRSWPWPQVLLPFLSRPSTLQTLEN